MCDVSWCLQWSPWLTDAPCSPAFLHQSTTPPPALPQSCAHFLSVTLSLAPISLYLSSVCQLLQNDVEKRRRKGAHYLISSGGPATPDASVNGDVKDHRDAYSLRFQCSILCLLSIAKMLCVQNSSTTIVWLWASICLCSWWSLKLCRDSKWWRMLCFCVSVCFFLIRNNPKDKPEQKNKNEKSLLIQNVWKWYAN